MSRKVWLCVVSVVLLPAVLVFLEAQAKGGPPEKAKAGTAAAPKAAAKVVGGERAILKALKQPTSLDFNKTPLQAVIDYIQNKHGIQIQLDKKELESMQIGPDTPVTRKLSGISLRSALDLILDDLQLNWVICREVLLITSQTKAESEEFLITKMYDVSDLVAFYIPDYPYCRSSLSTRPDEIPSPPPPLMGPGCIKSRCGIADFDSLIDLITQTVSPKSWSACGGPSDIAIYAPDLALVVSQTRQVHAEIAALLAKLRAQQRQAAPTVVVDLQWLWLDAGRYEQLLGGAKPPDAGRVQLAIDANVLDQVARKVPGFRGRIVCLNRQLVHLASGDRRSVIVSATPTVEVKAPSNPAGATGVDGGGMGGGMGGFFAVASSAGPSAPNSSPASPVPGAAPAANVPAPQAAIPAIVTQTAFQPVIDVPNVGVVVEVRPSVAPGANTALLDVRSTVTRWLKPAPPAQLGSAGAAACPVDRPNMPAAEMAMTARVPLGKPVLLGAVTFAPADGAGMDKPTDNPVQLCLIATTRIADDAAKPAKKVKKVKK